MMDDLSFSLRAEARARRALEERIASATPENPMRFYDCEGTLANDKLLEAFQGIKHSNNDDHKAYTAPVFDLLEIAELLDRHTKDIDGVRGMMDHAFVVDSMAWLSPEDHANKRSLKEDVAKNLRENVVFKSLYGSPDADVSPNLRNHYSYRASELLKKPKVGNQHDNVLKKRRAAKKAAKASKKRNR